MPGRSVLRAVLRMLQTSILLGMMVSGDGQVGCEVLGVGGYV
jgi:hypothetical protein